MNSPSILQKHISTSSIAISLLIAVLLVIFSLGQRADATAVDFKPGHIIDDGIFINASSMAPSQIQSFLNSKVPTCDTMGTQVSEYGGGTRRQWAEARGYSPPYTCLRDYSEGGKSSAQIIYDTAQEFSINPQVLIVLLQKEQGLVTDTWPLSTQYRTATGYGCPDTAACDTTYYGFTNQVRWAARMFRAIMDNSPTWYTPYVLGNNYIRWSPAASCGGSTVFIENRATQALYNYTPYQPNQSALNAGYGMGDSCGAYGNRNFYLYFRDWFGYNSGPVAFKTADSSTVYVPMQDYKIAIPSMALLQDYGVTANAIQVVSQAYVDAHPTPTSPTGISPTLSYVVKSPNDADEDGGSLYLISRGRRYQLQTMQQLSDFGFSVSDISYIPLSNIYSIPSGGLLQNFVTTPNSSEVFKVSAGIKSIFFQYAAYIAQNPSGLVTPLSDYLLDKLTPSQPITSGPVLVKYGDSAAIYVYQNGQYYLAPDYTTFSDCWRLDRELALPLFTPSQNKNIAPITSALSLNCFVNDGTNNLLLSNGQKSIIPSEYGITGQVIPADLIALIGRLPNAARPLSRYVKNISDSSVWVIDSNKKRLIPSYSNFRLLGVTDTDIDIMSVKATDSLETGPIKLADGQIVKSNSSPSVDVISGNARISYPSGELFNAYKNPWSSIETYADATLNAAYPNSGSVVSNYLVDSTQSKAYIIGTNGCYLLSQTTLGALGKSYAELSSTQSYNANIFKSLNLGTCKDSSLFVKHHDLPVVYWLDGTQKHPLNSYAAMMSKNNGQTPIIMEATSTFLSSIPTGTLIP